MSAERSKTTGMTRRQTDDRDREELQREATGPPDLGRRTLRAAASPATQLHAEPSGDTRSEATSTGFEKGPGPFGAPVRGRYARLADYS